MDSNKSVSAEKIPNKHLTAAMRLLMCLCTLILLVLFAVGLTGGLGLALLLPAAAFNAVLLIDGGRSRLTVAAVLAVNLVPFAVSVIASGSMIYGLTELISLIAALPVWLTVITGKGRSASVVGAAVCLTLFTLGLFAAEVYRIHGALTMETVNKTVDTLLAPLDSVMYMFSSVEIEGKTVELFTSEEIDRMLQLIRLVLLGSVASFNLVLAYAVTLLTRLLMKLTETHGLLPSTERICMRARIKNGEPEVEITHDTVVWRIELDSISAVIYGASFIVTLLFSPENSLLVYAVASNINAILTPAFVYGGARDVVLGFKGRSSVGRASKLVFFVCLMLLLMNPAMITMVLGVTGAIATLRENSARRNAELYRKE